MSLILTKKRRLVNRFFVCGWLVFFSGIFIPLIVGGEATYTENNDDEIIAFSDDILVSTDDSIYNHHVEPTIAIGNNDIIFVGWKNAYGHNTGGVRVGFSKSENKGQVWSEISYMQYFDGFETGQSDPWLVYQNGKLFYAYLEYSTTAIPLSQITVATSINEGDSWTIASATNGIGFADKETMTVDALGNIYVVYDDIADEDVYVRLTQSTNDGLSFVEKSIIADSITSPVSHLAPYVTTDSNNNVYVAWLKFTTDIWGDVFLTRSINEGSTFSEPVDLNPISENGTFTTSADGRPAKATLPVIRFDSNDRLYALWAELIEEDESWGVFLRYSDDFGSNWSTKYQINEVVTGNQWMPDMDIDSQNRLHIAYYDEQNNYYRPYYRLAYFEDYENSTIVLSKAIPVTNANTSAIYTRPGDYFTIRVDSQDIPHIVWTDGRNNEMDIYYSHGLAQPETKQTPLVPSYFVMLVIIPIMLIQKRKKNRKTVK